MIDFHCHLDLYPDPQGVVRECEARGLYTLSVTTTPSAFDVTSRLPSRQTRIRTALGLHPQLAHLRGSEITLLERLLPGAEYVGEVGLDGSPEFRAHWASQVDVFSRILALCTENGGRIMSIHSRRAATAVLDQLVKYPEAGAPVLHWFSGTLRDLDRAIRIGCWFSVGPAMLAGERGRGLVSRMPQDRVLTETDGPFAQIDGRSLMPWEAAQAVEKLASIWKVTPHEVERTIDANVSALVSTNR